MIFRYGKRIRQHSVRTLGAYSIAVQQQPDVLPCGYRHTYRHNVAQQYFAVCNRGIADFYRKVRRYRKGCAYASMQFVKIGRINPIGKRLFVRGAQADFSARRRVAFGNRHGKNMYIIHK